MSSADDLLVGRYDSLDALFCALNARTRPLFAAGGSVHIHPTLLPELSLTHRIATRDYLATFGLTLVITSRAAPRHVELRRYAAPRDPAAGGRSGTKWLPHR